MDLCTNTGEIPCRIPLHVLKLLQGGPIAGRILEILQGQPTKCSIVSLEHYNIPEFPDAHLNMPHLCWPTAGCALVLIQPTVKHHSFVKVWWWCQHCVICCCILFLLCALLQCIILALWAWEWSVTCRNAAHMGSMSWSRRVCLASLTRARKFNNCRSQTSNQSWLTG